MNRFLHGLRSGVPIGLGYLSVSFTFGILAVSYGLAVWQALLISAVTLTSAGQLAGLSVMVNPGQYVEMLVSQLTVNVRYSFMSVSLAQKTAPEFRGWKRWLFGFFMTDEIFAVAANEKSVDTRFFAGLTVMPYLGWTGGTLLGSILGDVLPTPIMNALCLAIYGMFVAIVAPKTKKSRRLLAVVGVAIALSCAFTYLPILNRISSGLSVSICAVAAAVFGALIFPIKEDSDE